MTLKRYHPDTEFDDYGVEYTTMAYHPEGMYYKVGEVVEYVEGLRKRIEALEGMVRGGCDSEEYF